MSELELRLWLNSAFYADKKIRALDMLIQRHRERAQGLSINWEGNDTGKTDGGKNGTENALLKLAELQEKADRMRAKAIEDVEKIQNAIALLEDDELETVLIRRYLLFETIDETAASMNYSPRNVRKKQKQAILKLCLKMPCNAHSDVL